MEATQEDSCDLVGAPAQAHVVGAGNTGNTDNSSGNEALSLQSWSTAALVAEYCRLSAAKSRREVRLGRSAGQVDDGKIESDPQKRLWLEQDLAMYVRKMAAVKAELWQRPDGPAAFLVGIDDTSELTICDAPVESVAPKGRIDEEKASEERSF